MTTDIHGLSIGIERIDNQFFMTLTAKGKLTHEDYQLITPMLENAIEGVQQPEINLFVDATELKGWELHAAWDDFKLGIKHGKSFEKIAIYGHKQWQEWAAKTGSWFIGGEAKFFEDKDEALQWLNQGT
ncbi:SpoIIAA family protein [Hydrogenovibrio kuenenii]|uniref:STAS/SEC14 domain-containing protein n=1 Tax=Hydrogenovibrio kuenenii TaxID=63658 RepID=UPI0004646324|nr:STAS/SEC14 domain-containing protein [Hydrogenovibrio kuenenii]